MQLLCLGDIAITEKDMPPWEPSGNLHPGVETKALFNWELPISDRINPVPRSSGPRLLADPESWRGIEKWAPGIAALANNHILYTGEGGLVKTLEILNRAGFTTVGAGQNHEEIRKPLLWETAEGRLAILNWVFPETHPDWLSIPGPCCWPGLDRAREEIRELKSVSDWLMVVAHWSDEHFPFPRPADRTIALELAQLDVDVIVGHHPHVARGMEWIGDCPVFYSIGNFYFANFSNHHAGWTGKQAPRNPEGLGVEISFQ
jgi:poly-gamma-glutamate capsule biosynthesis protein CapA/YwtB (metallophosphatase superfamily)